MISLPTSYVLLLGNVKLLIWDQEWFLKLGCLTKNYLTIMFQGLKIHEAQQKTLELHRDILKMTKLLQRDVFSVESEGPFKKGILGDSHLLGESI